jgi:hypothetical protein
MMLSMTEADALALAMLGVLAASFGCVLLILWTIYRRQKAGQCEVEELIREVGREEKEAQQVGSKSSEPATEPWEKDADWWRS